VRSEPPSPGDQSQGLCHAESVSVWAPGFLPLILVAIADTWVYLDARARQRRRRDVTATLLALEIETPAAWLFWCVVLFLVFFPFYLAARRAA